MPFQSVEQEIETIDQNRFDFILDFHRYIRNEEGVIDGDFKKYFPHLTLCEYPSEFVIAPKIIYSGSLSGTRKVFGTQWAESLSKNKATPDNQLEKLSAPGYQLAAERGYSCDIVDTVIQTDNGAQHLQFLRYIAQIETYSELKFFALAGKVLTQNLQ